ncbi:MAG: PfkB family carbohydrate kinase [Polyangiaceae bacterium]
MAFDVYVYGMTVLSTIHRVALDARGLDGYGEILETRVCPGGEGMNGALVLSGLGLKTALGGSQWGTQTGEVLAGYAARYGIDVRSVTRSQSHAGWRDIVIVNGAQRCVLGWFADYFAQQPRRWDEPDATAIADARALAIDPYFGDSSERAARLALDAGRPYVTIDCAPASALHRGAAATVVSREYRKSHYPHHPDEALLSEYAAGSSGLTIFTAGSQPILFARRGQAPRMLAVKPVRVISTLGAGDVFRAGVVYGVLGGFDDAECVRFAAELSAWSCSRFPIADNVPSLRELEPFS